MSASGEAIDADYVIVGAGSAGCVMAARLSENPATRVVLLEAGGHDRHFWIHVPLGYGKTITDKRVNWCYETEPEPNLNGRRVYWPRGKVLGGSSSINGLVYIRGQREDFDQWRQLGNTGWSFDDVLPYFRRAEHQTRGESDLHGTGGPLCVSDMDGYDPISKAFIKGAQSLGFPRNDDFNGSVQEGVGYYQLTTRNGRRCSTAVGYLRPAMKRPNLRVITNALSERITLDGRRATGVTFRRDGALQTVRAAREVILCGGAINSPQLMLLSGIGPAQHLTDLGITVEHDLRGRRSESAGPLPGAHRLQMPFSDHSERHHDEQDAHGEDRLAVSAVPQGRAQHCGRAGRTVRTHAAGAADAGHPVCNCDLQCRQAGGGTTQVLRLFARRLPTSPGKPRRAEAEVSQSCRSTGDASRTIWLPKPIAATSSMD